MFKMLKEGMAKVWLGSNIDQKAKIKYGLGFLLLKP